MSYSAAKIPATIITGFLGAGKTTMVRHLLGNANGRRLAVIVNEFGAEGVDGETLKSCGIEDCPEENIVELANGCLCCTVADDFLPTMQALIDRDEPPDHIVIETSGLALPKPLIKAFDWPDIRSRMTVDGVVAVIDGPAVAEGRFADDLEAVEAMRREDPSIEHDNPLQELYEDQLMAADIVVLNKTDLLEAETLPALRDSIAASAGRPLRMIATREGAVDPAVLLGLDAAAEDDLAARPSHHDGEDDHEHDDFESFDVALGEIASPESFADRLSQIAAAHDILRIKGFVAIAGKPMRLAVQGVGQRINHHYDRPWAVDEIRETRLVVIGQTGMDRPAITAALAA
ncbi:MAG: cobalamin biosynthesis protein CobW [Rhodospirillaceae bacterium]|nr:cobalamin biosynthesis protein CobW [Rhodospirillaceae bacterium]MYB12653.1 cobalamin biosynthesis protein CobW [Rhodospirillaceae bacterium]MYI50469.1 cobalamin biosynthesis protein CobW [Rhodospirillaceae bacterium]